ncbi:RNA polymerase sigma-70 factor [Parabacteroides sp. AM58-2XD]|uniref:RNA polymerase sigma-70 factor n=1 Tax=Parabacteroides TaxID=375288 RepID=UPI000FE1AED6|nr:MULTISPECIES: RNA polymerase sigma-70 factor [Parabacteroides]MCM0719113.1 RNA polymerase sigma-70 factor [Parabacteroides sp. W1-Q-101]RGZ02223.1 RNA polymerase sigma-70 factor [Parabacteroides sp. AM58-2XD]GKG72000.1 DNA-directed RNA polymerase sigma-70 factor [Parabacteroides goldsteinii]GKG77935.1 DNA-directed RNA polymerase sigma-70 factor [Parabacteroides goldsteinii]
MGEQQTESSLFSTLFGQFKEPFILFANSYVRDMAAAEDIYMEAIIQYWEKRKELPADTNIPGYILTTVKNKSLNHLRHQVIRTDVEDQLYDHRQRELNFRISSLESCDPSDLFTVEVKEIIRKTLNELPEQTRAIFFKSRYESKTNREIAAELEVSIKTVEFHISKALKLFRSRLKDYLPVLLVLTGISDF